MIKLHSLLKEDWMSEMRLQNFYVMEIIPQNKNGWGMTPNKKYIWLTKQKPKDGIYNFWYREGNSVGIEHDTMRTKGQIFWFDRTPEETYKFKVIKFVKNPNKKWVNVSNNGITLE